MSTANVPLREALTHPFDPLVDEHTHILILGSFPSKGSREVNFYYGYPMNRFWAMMAGIFHEDVPVTLEDKKHLLQKHHIGLWDVINSCTIEGSSDASIKDVVVNDIEGLLKQYPSIQTIICNGGTSYRLYHRYVEAKTHVEAIQLPSTSPANARWRLNMLIEAWGKVILRQ